MQKTKYQNLDCHDTVQTKIMLFVAWWVKNKKTTVPRKEIMLELTKEKIGRGTSEAALYALIDKGYIRKAYSGSQETRYVMLGMSI